MQSRQLRYRVAIELYATVNQKKFGTGAWLRLGQKNLKEFLATSGRSTLLHTRQPFLQTSHKWALLMGKPQPSKSTAKQTSTPEYGGFCGDALSGLKWNHIDYEFEKFS
ncbi:MAG: hypothetical protein HC936_14220 [Leptolyngbyaceae cyanobacterium SU_3_3]|nr:hypothetical protein [Leptolyngbyaceae cyanobacterium SU_3_3]NJR49417.1 hypothetical protein [Leptolyngbyaceae cyanobacterium CSU_1_3]